MCLTRAAAVRWLRPIADTYPDLLERLRRWEKRCYLEERDEDFDEYADGFGNVQDIVFGSRVDEGRPLAELIGRVLARDDVGDEDRDRLTAFLR